MTKHDKQRPAEVRLFIMRFTDENGFPPTLREIAAGVGLASASSVMRILDREEAEGNVKRKRGRARAVTMTPKYHGRG